MHDPETDWRIVLVKVVAGGMSGWREVTVGETPAYFSAARVAT
jgi:hypothetical protein